MIAWDHVTRSEVLRAIEEYDRLGPERFFSEHGFAPTTTYELVWEKRHYPPKAILGTAYEFATGERLGSSDFEGGKTGAVKVLGQLALLWQILSGGGFPNQFFNDSWVVGFLEGPTMGSRTSNWKEELGRFLEPFLDRLGRKSRRQMCPLYVAGLIGPGDRKS